MKTSGVSSGYMIEERPLAKEARELIRGLLIPMFYQGRDSDHPRRALVVLDYERPCSPIC